MKQMNELADILKKLFGLDKLFIGDDNVDANGLHTIRLCSSDYYLYIPENIAYSTAYFIKRILEIFLDNYLKNLEKENYLAHFTVLAEELLETYKSHPYEENIEIEGFQFLSELMDYAIVKDNVVICNKNIDKYTLDTSLLKLKTQDAFCMFVKKGEVFAAKTKHFGAVLSSNTEIEDIIKKAVMLRLAFINKLYETELYLNELKSINLNLEELVRLRTLEVENKNKLLEEEKIKLNDVNLKLTELNEYLDSLSRIDPLTRLSNRRDLQEKYDYRIKESGNIQTAFAVIIGDVDFFKMINDCYGHECGDQVLMEIADILRSNLRPEDIISRYGGDEFVIFIAVTDFNYTLSVVEKLRTILERELFEYNGKSFHITMSFGVFNFTGGYGLSQCLHYADEALYRAKIEGRNKVISMQLNG